MNGKRASGLEPGQRRLNGPQTTGREYRNLSTVEYSIITELDVEIPMRDGTILRADIRRPESPETFPALLASSPYPRQIQDLGAPAGVIEAGISDFFVPRGYAHVIVNSRGTVGSDGEWGFFDRQEREDLYDTVEWIAAQPWCDGNVGMTGISYYAMTQLEAAVENPPHLKAIMPFDVTVEGFEAANHNGLYSKAFITAWIGALGALSSRKAGFFRSPLLKAARALLLRPFLHRKFENIGGDNAIVGLRTISKLKHPNTPWNELWLDMAVRHQTRDAWWAERDLRPLLDKIDIPVYLGSEWSNVQLHLNGTFTAWDGMTRNPNVRMSILGHHGLPWPWESMHVESLAWFDQWLKGRDTGILEGPPIRYALTGAENTGWRTSHVWPPPADYRSFWLAADGSLASQVEAAEGSRNYLYKAPDLARNSGDAPLQLPNALVWQTPRLSAELDIVGHSELQLTASITAFDAAWMLLLEDVAPDGSATDVTEGWLRAALREVDESKSPLGRPELLLTTPEAVQPGVPTEYRIPIIATAHRFGVGHMIRLTLTSDDSAEGRHAMMNFTHAQVGTSSVNTVFASSRLLLPVLRESVSG